MSDVTQADSMLAVADHVEGFVARGKAFLQQHMSNLPFRATPAFEDIHALGEGVLRFLASEQQRAVAEMRYAQAGVQAAMRGHDGDAQTTASHPDEMATQQTQGDPSGATESQGTAP